MVARGLLLASVGAVALLAPAGVRAQWAVGGGGHELEQTWAEVRRAASELDEPGKPEELRRRAEAERHADGARAQATPRGTRTGDAP